MLQIIAVGRDRNNLLEGNGNIIEINVLNCLYCQLCIVMLLSSVYVESCDEIVINCLKKKIIINS